MRYEPNNAIESSCAALPGREIAKKYGIGKFVGFILIKMNTILGPVYVLEDRSADSGFRGRLGMYGGGVEGEEEITRAAVAELLEETGIALGDAEARELEHVLNYPSRMWIPFEAER